MTDRNPDPGHDEDMPSINKKDISAMSDRELRDELSKILAKLESDMKKINIVSTVLRERGIKV